MKAFSCALKIHEILLYHHLVFRYVLSYNHHLRLIDLFSFGLISLNALTFISKGSSVSDDMVYYDLFHSRTNVKTIQARELLIIFKRFLNTILTECVTTF